MSDDEEIHDDIILSDDEDNDENDEYDVDNDEDAEDDIIEENDDTCLMNLTSHKKIVNNHFDIQKKKIITPDESGVDPYHQSQPILTKYEITKIIGLRAQQLADGAIAMVTVPSGMTNVTDIATLELQQKKLPFIIKREFSEKHIEYWRIKDLQLGIANQNLLNNLIS